MRPSFSALVRAVPRLLYLCLLILAAWLLYYSLSSPYFSVQEIAVSGNRLLGAEQAREAAEALGRNALLLRTDDIGRSLRRISVVKMAEASLALPGRLRLEITERTPVVQWQVRGESFLVDREGVVFSREPLPIAVVLVRDVDGPRVEVGSRIDPGVLASVENLEMALPQRAGIKPQLFDYSVRDGVMVPVEGGPRMIFGDASDLDAKLANLAAIRDYLNRTKARAEVIDVRFKGRPLYVLAPPPLNRPR